MKKITMILCLLVTSLGFSQTIIEDFDPVLPGTAFFQDNGDGTVAMQQVTDPEVTRGNVLRLTTSASAPWQGAGLILQGAFLDLTNSGGPDDRKADIWVYSNTPNDILVKVTNGGPVSATDATHNGTGWEQLTFDFANNRDGTAQANGIYQRIIFFPAWGNSGGTCTVGCYPVNPAPVFSTYIDEISFGSSPNTTWTGNGDTNTNWNTAANWTNGVPTASLEAIIPNLTNDPIATGAVAVFGMEIEPGAAVTVNGAVTNSGVITVSSGASFIAKTSVSGSIEYERNLSSTNWYSISSPVIGQDVDNFVAASGIETAEANDVLFCTFDTTANYWDFYQNGTANADVLNPGQGYIVNLDGVSGDLTFTGTMNVNDVSIPLSTTDEGYNLLGNPYPSYIDSSAMLTGSSASLLSETIWVWDQSTDTYEVKVTVDNFQIAPGQGFFVQSNGVTGNVDINEAFQSHQGTDSFLRSIDRTEVYLTLSDGTNIKECKMYFIEGTTTGFDNGYDGPSFRAFYNNFSIYTHLITNNFGMDLGVQSLPNDDYDNLVIPVGITASSGTEITISANSTNLPLGIDIYLEDRLFNTFTLLNSNSDLTFTPTIDLNGTGRFYLHTSNDTLSTNELEFANTIQIYNSEFSKELIIKGLLPDNAIAKLYDLQGKLVLTKELDPLNNSNTLNISSLSNGLYVTKVECGNQSKIQKVIIK
ncbi:T9SS type A sorting domain-containing protein [Psychroserpens sp.]|uniref:T9SS type A sorting domain-containing protein n=1 Tax=Psychroserpens sp. TaxID=2020870 RepID=UPI002B26FD19|nr:T9SS type A sorting domain-containing protein [Psychroserpens sp.]